MLPKICSTKLPKGTPCMAAHACRISTRQRRVYIRSYIYRCTNKHSPSACDTASSRRSRMGICLARGDNCMYKHKRDVNQFIHNEDITCRGRPIDMRGSNVSQLYFHLRCMGLINSCLNGGSTHFLPVHRKY